MKGRKDKTLIKNEHGRRKNKLTGATGTGSRENY